MEFLDLKTLSLIALLTSIMLPLVLLSAVNAKHDDPVMMDWSRGATLYSVGFIGLSLRGLLPDFISIVVANLLVISGYFELHRGIRRFYQRHTSRRLLFIVGPVVGLIFVWFGLIDPSLTIRLIAFSGIVFALTAAISWEFFRASLEMTRRTRAGSASEVRIVRVLSIFFALSALLLLLRAIFSSVPALAERPNVPQLLNASAYLLAIAINFLVGACLPLLMSRRTQRELAHSEGLVTRAQEMAELGSLEINLRTNEVVTNKVADRLFGESVGQRDRVDTWLALVHPEDQSRMQARIRALMAGDLPPSSTEYRIIRRSDGATRWIAAVSEVRKDPVDGSPLMISTLRDITEMRMAALASERAMEAANAASRAKSEFLANMSHEIRTPLNGVIGMAQLLQHTPLTTEQSEYAHTIIGSAKSLLTIVNDILDFSKVEAGRLDIDPVHFSPAALLNDLKAIFTPQARAAEVALEIRSEVMLPELLVADAARLRQILSNLLSNAIKFSRQGRVMLTVRPASVAQDEHLELEFTISDTGIGMSGETLASLFNPFFQADASITRRFGGTGLGLSISQRLAELMGGSIVASSKLGVGSTFTLRLPFALAPAPGATPATRPSLASEPTVSSAAHDAGEAAIAVSPAPTCGTPDGAGAEILVVDDNLTNQTVARHMLTRLGYQVSVANHGGEALSLLGTHTFSAVLMDCQMPVMDGYEATARIRSGEAGEAVRHIPVVAMTANAMQADKELCLASGMNDFLSKPVVMDALRDTLARWVSGRQADTLAETPATAAVADAPDSEDLSAFDPETLLRYAMNDTDLAHALAESAVADMATEAGALSTAFAAQDAAAAQRHAHTLKGLSAQLGAGPISARYKELEQRFREGGAASFTTPFPARFDLAALDRARVALSASVVAWRQRTI